MKCRILRIITRIVARLRGSVGWCAAAYQFNRNGIPEEKDEYIAWAEILPQGIIKAWWGAFMFRLKPKED